MHARWAAVITLSLVATMNAPADDTADELIRQARAALAKGKNEDALDLASKAVAQEPKSAAARLFRGKVHEAINKHAEAVADFDEAIALDAKNADAYNRRGSEQFKLGRIKESLADFDKFLELKPDEKAGHWKRGISLYYAGKFEDGKRQFEGYEKVDTNDVENAVWHFLCNARLLGVPKAREAALKIGKDNRVPMMAVYDLFRGQAKPDDVLAAANAGDLPAEVRKPRLFYAHLYLGLFAEALDDKKKALEHLELAAEKYPISHYMGDVARVHRDRLRDELKNK